MGRTARRRLRRSTVPLLVILAVSTSALFVEGADQASSVVVTTTLAPVADSYVESTTPGTNYGTNARLIVDASPAREIFLRFDLSALTGPVQDARLRLHVADVTDAQSPSGGTVALVNNTTWTETGITYNNRPTSWGNTVATVGAVSRNTWVEIPVTSAVTTGGKLTLGFRSTNDDGAFYDSRQTTATAPQLIVTSGTSTSTSSTTSSTTTTTTRPSSGSTTTLAPVADAYVDSSTPTTNYGTNAQLVVDASPVRETFLRFTLSALSGTVQDARLRLHVADVTNAESPNGGTVAVVSNNSWTEAGLTYNNRPTSWGATVASVGAASRNTWVEIPVTSAVTTGGQLTLGLRSTNDDGAFYDSRQTTATAPQLIVTTGSTPPPATVRIAAVGDQACTTGSAVTASQCRQLAVSNLVAGDPSIQLLLSLGDLAYENGSAADFQNAYGPSYGRFKAKTKPTVGNHEYGTSGASGYFNYFGSVAGNPAQGWYSYDIGSAWHVVTLNSNCGPVSCTANGAQVQWLRADLAANTKPCVLTTFHHPRFASGDGVGNDPEMGPFWDALQQYGTDISLNGHVHNYERFAPQLPNATASASGIREFIVGTGGRSLFGFDPPVANSVVRLSVFGLLKLDLGAGTYSWQFVDESGAVRDSGTGTCH
jgi:acid phosphatase type 7